jgi:DNA polymerase I-like protein with 3'-5' exonuclease and polymerase domains
LKPLQVILNPQHIDLEPVVGLDVETTGLQSWIDKVTLIMISTSSNIYILDTSKYHPQFITEVLQNMQFCQVVVAHNAKFDCGFLYTNYGVLLRNWWCTQIASQLVVNGKQEYKGKHSLPEVIERFLKEQLEFSEKNKKLLQKSFTSQYKLDNFTEKQLRYASDDVKFLIPLYRSQQRAVDNLQLKAIVTLENKLLPVLAKMESEGCFIDAVGWRNLIKEYWIPDLYAIEARLDDEVRKLNPSYGQRRVTVVTQTDLFGTPIETKIAGGDVINFASSEQVLQLFGRLGEEVPLVEVTEAELEAKKKKKNDKLSSNNNSSNYSLFVDMEISEDELGEGSEFIERDGKYWKPSLDEISLSTYVNERPKSRMKPFIKELLNYRIAAKRISTYGEKFLGMLDVNSCIHTGYTQTFTDTGRLSSKAPNLQNIPAPEKGKPETDIRRFFQARPGYKLITCDMAGAEVAIAADYSQEPLLLASLREGVDMHSQLASISYSIIFGQPVTISKSEEPFYINGHKLIPVELRDLHKSVVFAKFYKAGSKRIYSVLAEYINMFHSEESRLEIASQISQALDKRMPRLSKYLDSLIKKAQKEGFLRGSRLGRLRYFTEDAYGECANYPIQNSNAEALKMAMVEVFLYFESCGFDGRIVINVHDELLCEVKDDGLHGPGNDVNEAAIKVKQIMATALSYFLKTIKGGASISIGDYWKK